MIKFHEFLDKKEREAKKQLKIIEKILSSQNVEVKDHLDDDDPYIFVHNPKKNTFFGGVRVYKIGEHIAFRVQKDEKTEPFGKAYGMDIEEMFTDLISDYKPEEAGKKIMKAVVNEIKTFFEKSSKAEKELRDKEFEFGGTGGDPWSKVKITSDIYGNDYGNMVTNYMKS